jgi:Putative Actinobacterial Holin-X, holin superfamily III
METSTRELVQDLSRQTSTLIRQEMRLAQAELTEKGRHAGKGASEQALESVHRDVETVKARARS